MMSCSTPSAVGVFVSRQSAGGEIVSAITRPQVPRDTRDRCDADPCELVYFTIGKAALEVFDHSPAIRHGLKLGRGTQISEKGATFVHRFKGEYGLVKVALRLGFLTRGLSLLSFHSLAAGRFNVVVF